MSQTENIIMEIKMHRERKLKILAFAEGVIKGLTHALQYNHVAPEGDIRWEIDDKSGYDVCIQLHNEHPNCYVVYATPYERVEPYYESVEDPDVPSWAPTPLTIKYDEEVLVALQLEADKPFVVVRNAKTLGDAYKEVNSDEVFDSYEGISKEERELYNSVPPSSSMTPTSREKEVKS